MANKPVKKTRSDGVTQTYYVATAKTPKATPSASQPASLPGAPIEALATDVTTQVEKFLHRISLARGPQSRRDNERFFAAKLARLDGISPVEAAYLQKAYRDCEAATSYTEEMTNQRILTEAVTRTLFPGATSLTFRIEDVDRPVLVHVKDAAGNSLYAGSSSDGAASPHAQAVEAFLGAFHHDALADYFTPTAAGWVTRF